jgi:hypothetical protein
LATNVVDFNRSFQAEPQKNERYQGDLGDGVSLSSIAGTKFDADNRGSVIQQRGTAILFLKFSWGYALHVSS